MKAPNHPNGEACVAGVITACRYCEVQPGSGESPLAGDLILVDYTAR
jgi:hypothetical protein